MSKMQHMFHFARKEADKLKQKGAVVAKKAVQLK